MVGKLILGLLNPSYLKRSQSSTSLYRTMAIQEGRIVLAREETVEMIEMVIVISKREIRKITTREMTSMISTTDKVEEGLRIRAVVKGLSTLRARRILLEVRNFRAEAVSLVKRKESIRETTQPIMRLAIATMINKTL